MVVKKKRERDHSKEEAQRSTVKLTVRLEPEAHERLCLILHAWKRSDPTTTMADVIETLIDLAEVVASKAVHRTDH